MFLLDNLFAPSPRRREGILWIYGDSLALRFYDSIYYTPLCTEIFKACNITYNWVYNMNEPVEIEKYKRNYRDFDPWRVLNEIRDVIYLPQMDEKSVIVLNCGLHYVSSLKFAVYRKLIDDIIAMFKETWVNKYGKVQLKFRGKLIWKTTTAIHRERFLYHDHPSPRFLTLQVTFSSIHRFHPSIHKKTNGKLLLTAERRKNKIKAVRNSLPLFLSANHCYLLSTIFK